VSLQSTFRLKTGALRIRAMPLCPSCQGESPNCSFRSRFFTHLSFPRLLCHRTFFNVQVGYPAGNGRLSIHRSLLSNSRHVIWLSANRSQ